jgi:hypothetical protein
MAFTSNSDIFASFHEDGLNRIVEHVRRQRPSLFNYATAALASAPEKLCRPIDAHPIVGLRGNPRVTEMEPLPVPGTDFGMNFSVQVADLKVDFHPGGKIALPPQLAPLPAQRMALGLTVCVGIGCPSRDVLEGLIAPPDVPEPAKPEDPNRPDQRLVPIPTGELVCFCLGAFAIAGVRIKAYSGKNYLEPFLDRLEIVDVKPDGLESGLECYISTVLRLSLLPQLRILLESFTLELLADVSVAIKPTPTSAAVPNNPAIEQNQLKAFATVEVI